VVELFTMWRSTRMVVLTAVCAALYASILIPFKVVPLIPGVTELRPASAVPVVCSFLFGPAGAWGAAFGNAIGELFGGLGPGDLFGEYAVLRNEVRFVIIGTASHGSINLNTAMVDLAAGRADRVAVHDLPGVVAVGEDQSSQERSRSCDSPGANPMTPRRCKSVVISILPSGAMSCRVTAPGSCIAMRSGPLKPTDRRVRLPTSAAVK
jgi:hypothetical protein